MSTSASADRDTLSDIASNAGASAHWHTESVIVQMHSQDNVKALVERLIASAPAHVCWTSIAGKTCREAAAELTRLAQEVDEARRSWDGVDATPMFERVRRMEAERDALRAENARTADELSNHTSVPTLDEGEESAADLRRLAERGDWDVLLPAADMLVWLGMNNTDLGCEVERLRSLLIECQSRLDGDPKSDELFERINECTK